MKVLELLTELHTVDPRERAAKLLNVSIDKLSSTDRKTADAVLDAGREEQTERIKTPNGDIVIRLFKLNGKRYARIESTRGALMLH